MKFRCRMREDLDDLFVGDVGNDDAGNDDRARYFQTATAITSLGSSTNLKPTKCTMVRMSIGEKNSDITPIWVPFATRNVGAHC